MNIKSDDSKIVVITVVSLKMFISRINNKHPGNVFQQWLQECPKSSNYLVENTKDSKTQIVTGRVIERFVQQHVSNSSIQHHISLLDLDPHLDCIGLSEDQWERMLSIDRDLFKLAKYGKIEI